MAKKKKGNTMVIPTIIMGTLAILLTYLAFRRGDGSHILGMTSTAKMTVEILPLLLFSFIVAGMIQVLIPRETIAHWVGAESGLRGIFIGAFAGGLMPGGPFVSLPIAASIMKAGAGIGTMVAFLTGWSLWAVSRLPLEVGILGWKFTLVRMVCTMIFPPLAGLIAQAVFSGVKW